MKRRLLLILASIILCGSTVFAQSNHWSLDNPGAYASHLNTWIAVELDGVRLASTDIELAAFVDGECRGVERLQDWGEINGQSIGYLACIQIFKDNAGDVINFKMYDHATETEYDDCSTTVVTQVAGEEMGATPLDPTVAVFTSPEPVGPTAPEHPWVPASFPSNMSIFAEIQINGVPQSGDNWEVGAFCGDECRGDQVGTVPAPTEFGQMLSMVVYGVDGDVMNFYLYDIENQSIVGECSTTVTYVEQGNAGVVWDPLILNFITTVSFNLDILGYGDNEGKYYLIASPIGEVSPEDVTFMLSNSYDLFYFDQTQDLEWINYKPDMASTNPGFNLLPGKGYLYANSNDVTLSFIGQAYNGSGDVTLYKDDNAEFSGWNLVGNPFAQSSYITKPFYTMNSDGTELVAGEGNEVGAMQGIFVIAEENEEIMNFSTDPIDAKGQIVLNVSQERGNTIDRAIVRFDGQQSLPKFMLNGNNTKLYIQQGNQSYALVNSSKDSGMPLNFKSDSEGRYTIKATTQLVELSYFHLIDNLTGTDVDLLATPIYNFNASKNDPEDRFTINFRTNASVNVNENNNPINYYQNGRLTINGIQGEGDLEVIDMFGRILSCTKIQDGYSQVLNATPGIYLIRVTTVENTYSQKIVVK